MGGAKKKSSAPKAAAASSGGASAKPPKVCGPSFIETLRGKIFGKDVALILCGEAHEEAIDLTREKCITEPEIDWVQHSKEDGGFDMEDVVAKQEDLTLAGAKKWAERALTKAAQDSDDEGDEDEGGEGYLLYKAGAKGKGTAWAFLPDAKRSKEHALAPEMAVWELGDLDPEARDFNRRRLQNDRIPEEEHDALIAKRKERHAGQVEFLDDWWIRQAKSEAIYAQVLLEAPVDAKEVELQLEDKFGPAPPAHKSLREIEFDSDGDSEDDEDPDDGTGSFADYFTRRVLANLPKDTIRGVDPRDMGDPGSDSMREAFQKLSEGLPPAIDVEAKELDERLGPKSKDEKKEEEEGEEKDDGESKEESGKSKTWKDDRSDDLPPLPSWEAFFSAAAEILYYSPQVKTDFTPFLAKNVGSLEVLTKFLTTLYFGTVPDAVQLLKVDDAHRPFAQTRSLAYVPPGGDTIMRRRSEQVKIPVRAAPLGRYLKARGSNPPRTWLSGMAHNLEEAGGQSIVKNVQKWLDKAVTYLLNDPKEADEEGDYFAAWLRANHREIWNDIDRSDPTELRCKQYMPSRANPKSKKHRHNLKDITIPHAAEMFQEFKKFDPDARCSTARERTMAMIIIDAFQLRLVDAAMSLAVADAVLKAPGDKPVVVMLYAGEDHTRSVADFWRKEGLSAKGLNNQGKVGKRDWEEDEPKTLTFPDYLQDVSKLFPEAK